MDTWDDDEDDRLEHIMLAKQRGKGAPKKKRTADGESLPRSRLRCDSGMDANTWSSESKKFRGKKKSAPAAEAP